MIKKLKFELWNNKVENRNLKNNLIASLLEAFFKIFWTLWKKYLCSFWSLQILLDPLKLRIQNELSIDQALMAYLAGS